MDVSGFNHLTLNVRQLTSALNFYLNKLGVTVIHKGKHDAYLEWGGAWLCLQERPTFQAPAHEHIGFDLVAFSINEGAFDEAVAELRAAGITIEKGPIVRGIGRSVYFRDMDGNLLELHTSYLHERMTVWK
jgi:catechol 2,3-dioxygenase-like lactoylglutathione lyase family enzyme